MEDNKPHIVSDDKATAWWRWFVRRSVLLPLAALIVIAVGAWVILSLNTKSEGVYTDDQATLEASLMGAKSATNAKGIVELTTALIDGEKKDMFTYNPADLSQLYLDRASAQLNLGKYREAMQDFKQAATVDANSKIAALQGEVDARYRLGERKELIPLFEQLITLIRNSENPMRASVIMQYQSNIEALQRGESLDYYET